MKLANLKRDTFFHFQFQVVVFFPIRQFSCCRNNCYRGKQQLVQTMTEKLKTKWSLFFLLTVSSEEKQTAETWKVKSIPLKDQHSHQRKSQAMTIRLAESGEAGLWLRVTTRREENMYSYLHKAPSCITSAFLNLATHIEILILPLVTLPSAARI